MDLSPLKNNNSFPFTKGKGLEKTLEIIGYKCEWIIPKKIIRVIPLNKFEIFNINQEIKIMANIRADNIRKKIKSSFHKNIIQIINNKIKLVLTDKNEKKIFNNLPQSFITNVNKSENVNKMELKFKQLLLNWNDENNKKLINFLDDNPVISEQSGWNLIKNMTYKELLKAFLLSEEFEKSIIALRTKPKKSKKFGLKYIENYINIAFKYIEFFCGPDETEDTEPQMNNNSSSCDDSFDSKYKQMFGEVEDKPDILKSFEDNKEVLRFEEPSKINSVENLEDESVVIKKNNNEEEECFSQKEIISQLDNSLDEKPSKNNYYEKDAKKVLSEIEKKFS